MRRAVLAALLLMAGAALPVVAQGDRPAIAEEVEKRFADRFMVVTDGGAYTIYQRLEANLSSPREVICLMRECYVALATGSEEALRRASRDPAMRRPLLQLFALTRDAYGKVLATPEEARAEAEAAWLGGAARIAPCLMQARCADQ